MLETENLKFSPRSLPYSLNFFSRDDALENARSLARFLQDATESMATAGTLGKENAYGLYQCFNLLTDELDIASGAYLFPMASHHEAKELFQRRED